MSGKKGMKKYSAETKLEAVRLFYKRENAGRDHPTLEGAGSTTCKGMVEAIPS